MKKIAFLTFIFLSIFYQPCSFAADTIRMSLPEGAKARLGKGSIKEVAYSPNGKHLAVAGSIGIWLYDMTTYQEVALLTEYNTGTTNGVAFSPDGSTIVSGSDDGTIRLWDTDTGKHKQKFADAEWVLSVAFSPDGNTIASGGGHMEGLGDGIYLRNAHTGKLQKTLLGHVYDTLSVCFSPDGKTLASGGQAGNNDIRLWDLDTGERLETLGGQGWNDVNSVVFSPDGNIIASGSEGETIRLASGSEGKTIRLWSPHTGLLLKTLTGHTASVNSVVFSPIGNTLISAGGDSIRLWSTRTGEHLKTLSVSAMSVVFSPDGNTFVSGSSDGIRVWNTQTHELLKTFIGYTSSVGSVVYSPDGNIIASGNGNDIDLWDANTNELLKTLIGHTESVNSVVFSSDGNTIASSSNDKTVRLWNTHTGKRLKTLKGHAGRVHSAVFSSDGNTIASSSNDKTVRLWNTHTGEHLKTLKGHIENVNSVTFSPDGKTIASGSGELVYIGEGEDVGTCVGQEIRLWDAHTGEHLKTLKGHTSVVNSVVFSPDGNTIVSGSGHWQGYEGVGSAGEEIRLWNAHTGEHLKTLTGHKDVISSVVFSPDGNLIVSGDWYSPGYYRSGAWVGDIYVWDAHTGEHLKTLKGHTGGVSSVAVSPDGKTLASGRTDGTILLWDLSD